MGSKFDNKGAIPACKGALPRGRGTCVRFAAKGEGPGGADFQDPVVMVS